MAYSSFDLNTATEDDLLKVPGIGRESAMKILSHQPFKDIDDLYDIPFLVRLGFVDLRCGLLSNLINKMSLRQS